MSPLLRWLEIVRGRQERAAYEVTRGKLQASNAPEDIALGIVRIAHASQEQNEEGH